MNRTKKLTQGAMMIAIVGAMVLLDRLTAYWLTEIVYLIAPVVIVMYAAMYTVKDGIFVAIGVMIIALLLGNFNLSYMIYMPVGIITAIVYSFGLKKNMPKSFLLLSAIIVYIIGEVVVTFIVYPLMGIPVVQQLTELKEMFDGTNYFAGFEALKLDVTTILAILYIISTMITGAMEGLLIHLLSVFLLKRFRIMNIATMNLFDIKANPVLAYVSIACVFGSFLSAYVDSDTIKYAALIIAVFGGLVLMFYGYIYLTLYGRLVLHKNIAVIVVILSVFMPVVLIGLLIIGFLYASGPLRYKLEERLNIPHE